MRIEDTLDLWHEFVTDPQVHILDEILADNVKFHSPFVWKPKLGKEATITILMTVVEVFDDFGYVREIVAGKQWALEFEAKIGELDLRGVDLFELNDEGKIVDLEVMVRPANGLQALGLEMAKQLMQQSPTGQELLADPAEESE
jgi:hypothetical protein